MSLKTNLNNKYKDRLPEDTIKKVIEFFESKNLNTRIINEQQSQESGTWSCGVEILDLENNVIFSSCGKGMDKNFSRASGYAEAYERFCNGVNNRVLNNVLLMRKISEINKRTKGYYLHPQEKILSFEEVFNAPNVKDFYSSFLGSKENVETFFKAITNEILIGVPYKNIKNNKDIHYYDPRILSRVTTTIGMSAGNSIEECLNQGLSELFEVFVTDWFYDNEVKEAHFIDRNTITNKELLNTLEKIESNGFKIYILDLSYNFNVPVVASMLFNPFQYNVSINFGSFPIFDIALERVLTELYQGINRYKTNDYNPQIPYKGNDFCSEMMGHLNNRTGATIFPESIFLNCTFGPYNDKVFLNDNNYSNLDINNYYIELCDKLGYTVYYRDVSQCEDMKAIQLFTENLSYGMQKARLFLNGSKILKNENTKLIQNLQQLVNNVVDGKDYIDNLKVIYTYLKNNTINGEFLGNLLFSDWSLPYVEGKRDHIFYLYQIVGFIFNRKANLNMLHIYENDDISLSLKYFKLLSDYIDIGTYTNEEIINFVSLFGKPVEMEDLKNIDNSEYLFNKIYVENLQNIYYSKEYENYAKIFWSDYFA